MKKLNLFSNLRSRVEIIKNNLVNYVIHNVKPINTLVKNNIRKEIYEIQEFSDNIINRLRATEEEAAKKYLEFNKSRLIDTLHKYNIFEYDKVINNIKEFEFPGYITIDTHFNYSKQDIAWYQHSFKFYIKHLNEFINNTNTDYKRVKEIIKTAKNKITELTTFKIDINKFDCPAIDILYDILRDEIYEYNDDLCYKYIDEYLPEYNDFLENNCLEDLPAKVLYELNFERKIEFDGSCYDISGAVFEYLEYRKNQDTTAA